MACRYLENGSDRLEESLLERCEESGCPEKETVPRGTGRILRSARTTLDFSVELALDFSIDVEFVDAGSWILVFG